jgi:hypothetical protein
MIEDGQYPIKREPEPKIQVNPTKSDPKNHEELYRAKEVKEEG